MFYTSCSCRCSIMYAHIIYLEWGRILLTRATLTQARMLNYIHKFLCRNYNADVTARMSKYIPFFDIDAFHALTPMLP